MSTSTTRLEDVVRELQELAKARPLKGAAKVRGRQLMAQLKKWGFTNQEIVELTRKAWSEQSIKQEYTRGASVEDTSVKQRALELLSEVVARHLALDDVEEAVAMSSDLADREVTYDQVGSLLQEVGKSNVTVPDLIRLYVDTRRASMSLANLAELRTYKTKLDAEGLTLDRLTQINKALETSKNPDEVLRGIIAYKTIAAIDAQIRELSSKEKQYESSIAELTAKGAKLRAEQQHIQGRLDLADRLAAEGFDESTLNGLAESSAKFGGAAGVITAINAFSDLSEIKAEIEEQEKKQSEAETNLKQAKADWSHQSSVIRMAEALLYELKFSPEAITRMYKIARLYGEPLEVLNALGKYGSMKELRASIDELESRRSAVEARLKELEMELQRVRGFTQELTGATEDALKPIAASVKKAIEDINSEFREGAEKLGALKKEAEHLGSEVRLAQIILTVDKFPNEAKNLSADYALLLLGGVRKLLRAKGLNPKFKIPVELSKKYWSYTDREFETLNLIDWLYMGLNSTLGT